MPPNQIDEALHECEAALRRAQLTSDVAALDQLLDEALMFTGPDGKLYDKAADLEAHREGWVQIRRLVPSEERIQQYGSVAVVSVRMDMAGSWKGEDFAGPFRYTRVWLRTVDRWRLVAGHVSAAPPASEPDPG